MMRKQKTPRAEIAMRKNNDMEKVAMRKKWRWGRNNDKKNEFWEWQKCNQKEMQGFHDETLLSHEYQ